MEPILFYGYRYCFSNFAKFNIRLENHIFVCNEQYIMWKKAMIFGDKTIALKILACTNPVEMKKLGKQIKNFNQVIWERHIPEIADACNWAKFSQHTHLKHYILKTKDAELAEASPNDKIWGIGVDIETGKNKLTWCGQNLLGKSLMRIRERLKKENVG